jgi:hypothetical protein
MSTLLCTTAVLGCITSFAPLRALLATRMLKPNTSMRLCAGGGAVWADAGDGGAAGGGADQQHAAR